GCRRPCATWAKPLRCNTSTRCRGWRGRTRGCRCERSLRSEPCNTGRPWTASRSLRGGVVNWRVRVVHTTGYRYAAPVTQSYNEARLTPRSDRRQNLIVSRLETEPPTRSYRYTDYWGTEVTAFDLHAPHLELKIVSSSVVETGELVSPVDGASWADMRAADVKDRYAEFLEWTGYVPKNRELAAIARELRKGRRPSEAVLAVS